MEEKASSSAPSVAGWNALLLLVAIAHLASWFVGSAYAPNSEQAAAINSTAANSVATWDAAPWRMIGVFKNVETYVKSVPHSKLHAMRGVTTLALHISDAMSHFYDVRLAHEWIDMLDEIREYSYPPPDSQQRAQQSEQQYQSLKLKEMHPLTDDFEYSDAVYEIMKLPWPIAPRDILLKRDWAYDVRNKTVTVRYASFDDPVRCPELPHRIRAWSPHTLWRFHFVDHSSTRVEIECLVDSKGTIPSWFINFMQRSFPSDSLSAFDALAQKKKVPPHRRVLDW